MRRKDLLLLTLLLTQTFPAWGMKNEDTDQSSTVQQQPPTKKKKGKVSFTHDGDQTTCISNKDQYIAIYLDEIKINRVSNPDFLSKDEGTVTIKFDPQGKATQTSLFWSGWTKKGAIFPSTSCLPIGRKLKFKYGSDLLVYFGALEDLKDRLDFSVAVIEDDEADKKKWEKAAEAIATAGKIAKGIPQYGEPISASLGVVSSLVDVIAQSHSNTTELFYSGDFLKNNDRSRIYNRYKLSYTREGKTVPDLEICFNASPLPAIPYLFKTLHLKNPDTNKVKVILESLEIHDDISKTIGAKLLSRKITGNPIFGKLKGGAHLEVKVGDTSTSFDSYANAYRQGRFEIESSEVYKGEWKESGLPASVSLVYTKEPIKLTNLITSAAGLVKSVIPEDKVKDNPTEKAITNGLDEAMQTISSSVIAGVAPESKHTLFSLGINLLHEEKQRITFPMYDNAGGNDPLGTITATMRIIPWDVKKETSEPKNPESKEILQSKKEIIEEIKFLKDFLDPSKRFEDTSKLQVQVDHSENKKEKPTTTAKDPAEEL